MTGNPQPSITVNVDVTNPGQFFACCGLLELADCLWPGADVLGSFTPPRFERSRFRVFSKCNLDTPKVLSALCNSQRTPVDPYRPIMASNGKLVKDPKKIKPIRLEFGTPGASSGVQASLRLSWWLDELCGRQTAFKMWAAHKTSEDLINNMADKTPVDEMHDKTVLESPIAMTARLGLDTRSSWNTLDEGFSPNEQNLPVDTYPATELLAAVGLQTFPPSEHNDGFVYACWRNCLPAPIARAVASGAVSFPGITHYRFAIKQRGRFGFFTKASRLERSCNG